MITEKEVQHIAKLARLGLTQGEIKKMQRELSSILDYIEKLGEVAVAVEPTSHPLELKKVDEAIASSSCFARLCLARNVMREDEESKKPKAKSQKLLELAPETKAGYLKVKSIFNK